MSVPSDTIQPITTRKEAKMTVAEKTYKVGDLFTTLKSNVTGTILEIVPNASGSVRVKLDTEDGVRWTTVFPTE